MPPNMPLGSGWPDARQRKLAATVSLVQNYAGNAESEMKTNRPWRDRTGMARNALTGRTAVDLQRGSSGFTPRGTNLSMNFGGLSALGGGGSIAQTFVRRISLLLTHGVSYGKWLETVSGAAMGRRRFMSSVELERSEFAGPYAILHPTAKRTQPRLKAAVLRIWRRPI